MENILSFPFEEENKYDRNSNIDYLEYDLFSSLKNLLVPPNVEYEKGDAIKLGKNSYFSSDELIAPSFERKKHFSSQNQNVLDDIKSDSNIEDNENDDFIRGNRRENVISNNDTFNIVVQELDVKKGNEYSSMQRKKEKGSFLEECRRKSQSIKDLGKKVTDWLTDWLTKWKTD